MRNIRTSAACLLLLAVLARSQSAQQVTAQHAMELQRAGDFEGAAREYRAFLTAYPDDAGSPGIRSNLGVVLARLGRYDEAEREYAEALRLDPANRGMELNLALAYYKSGRIPDAARLLDALLPHAPDTLQASLLLADCYLRMGDNGKVISLLQPLRAANPDNLGTAYLLGTALIRERRIDEGQRVIDRILKDGDSPETHFLLGSQMFAAGDFPGAVHQFQAAAHRNPDLPSLQSYYGQALLNTGDPDAAVTAFRRELARDPNDFDANLHLAQILLQRQKPLEAAPLLQRALRVRPGSPQVAAVLARKTESPTPGESRPAPDFNLNGLAPNTAVSLRSYRGRSPVLLVFGSYSCPNFRSAAPALLDLYRRYGAHVPFLMVYIREAHSTADWQSTRNEGEGIVIPAAKTMGEKMAQANLCVRKLNLPFPAVVDGMDGKVEADYAAWPSRAFLVDREGIIRFSTGLTEQDFHPAQLEAALRSIQQ